MPDWSFVRMKYNPGQDGNRQSTNPLAAAYEFPDDPNAGDWSGYVLGGNAKGVLSYKRVSEVLEEEGSAVATPAALNHVTAEARLTNADGTGLFIFGHGVKAASGANASSPMQWFPASAAFLAAYTTMKWKVAAIFAVNGTGYPDTSNIDVGFYPLTVSGGAGDLAYTLSTSGQIVESYGDGLGSGLNGRDNPDRRAAFVSGGDQNYGVGVNIGDALPSGCVIDVSIGLQLTPY